MSTPISGSLLLIGVVGALGGCAALVEPAPRVDAAFGDSVRQAVAMQTANRDAGKAANGQGGFDAQSAVSAIARHRDSFKTPPPTFTVIGIGGSGGGGGGQ